MSKCTKKTRKIFTKMLSNSHFWVLRLSGIFIFFLALTYFFQTSTMNICYVCNKGDVLNYVYNNILMRMENAHPIMLKSKKQKLNNI